MAWPCIFDLQLRLLCRRYMAAHVRQDLDPRDSVTVVAGVQRRCGSVSRCSLFCWPGAELQRCAGTGAQQARTPTCAAGRDTFGLYRHEAAPRQALDAAALEEHRRAVGRVYPDGYQPRHK